MFGVIYCICFVLRDVFIRGYILEEIIYEISFVTIFFYFVYSVNIFYLYVYDWIS